MDRQRTSGGNGKRRRSAAVGTAAAAGAAVVQALESRWLLAANLMGTNLVVTGTGGDDDISVTEKAGPLSVKGAMGPSSQAGTERLDPPPARALAGH